METPVATSHHSSMWKQPNASNTPSYCHDRTGRNMSVSMVTQRTPAEWGPDLQTEPLESHILRRNVAVQKKRESTCDRIS